MAFRISARTVLEMGADLISSDDVAIYELVKNAIDAGSRSGVEIRLAVTLPQSAYVTTMQELDRGETTLEDARAFLLDAIEPTAPEEQISSFTESLESCKSISDLKKRLPDIYAASNFIEFRDTGRGMTEADLRTKFLVIGTPSRKVAIDKVESEHEEMDEPSAVQSPYLGEKGIGRLSAMRLGWSLHLESATSEDKRLNVLDIDWRQFGDLTLFVEDIEIAPKKGDVKSTADWSGTILKIMGLTSTWTPRRIRDVAVSEFAKITDPFSLSGKRFRIAVYFNGERIEIPRMEQEILKIAHATVRASYRWQKGPILDVNLTFKGPEHEETKHLRFEAFDVTTLVDDADQDIPPYALRSVGPFDYEAYWYNRQRLRAVDSIGNLNAVRDLQRRWAGIMLFRDGYRVLPYGEDKDDWLGLDRKALASTGYKLNTKQFIGRAAIGRISNPKLVDQTNREGLKEGPEKYVFVELLRFVTQTLLRDFMNDVEKRQRHVDIDVEEIEQRIEGLETRATQSIRRLRSKHKDSSLELKDLLSMFEQMKEYFLQAKSLAEQAEDERARLIQLAGIGLMLEVVAHELARSTETAMKSLAVMKDAKWPPDVASTLKTLRVEMQTMNKRLRVLDPLSVSGRNRKEHFDLVTMVREVFEGRKRQLRRHGIDLQIHAKHGSTLMLEGVKGMYVQIVENLASNSVFWLKKQKKENPSFSPEISITLDVKRKELRFDDNGPGVNPSLKDDIFRPFFSTKDRKRRQGLGLYIARECATYNGARLYLSDQTTVHENRHNTFILELPD